MAKKHSELTDPQLHNLKGFAAASNSTAPTKDSSGNYVWAPISSLGGVGPAGPSGPAGASLQTKHANVRVATTAAGTLASSFENGDTVDGVVLATSDRILIKDQATASQNGIYVVAASGSPARASGMSAASVVIPGDFVWANEGTVNKARRFQVITSATIGVDSVNFNPYEELVTPPPLALTKDISVTTAQAYSVPKNLIGTGTGTTLTVNWNNGNTQLIDLQDFSGNVTFTLSNPQDGAVYNVWVIQGSTARNIVWPAAVKWPDALAPTITTTNNKKDLITLMYVAADAEYLGTFLQNFG